jgi:hypothetical protein
MLTLDKADGRERTLRSSTLIASEQAVALVAPKQADRAPVALTLPDERDILVVPMRTAQAVKTLLAQAPAG